MSRRSLLENVCGAVGQWRQYCQEDNKFKRWLRLNELDVSLGSHASDDNFCLAIACLTRWVRNGVEEVVLNPRTLLGCKEIESHPDFWKPDWSRALQEGIALVKEHQTLDRDYARKWGMFTRIDEYCSCNGKIELTEGFYQDQVKESLIPILYENLKKSRTMKIVGENSQSILKGRICTFSVLMDKACGVLVDGCNSLGIKITYQNA